MQEGKEKAEGRKKLVESTEHKENSNARELFESLRDEECPKSPMYTFPPKTNVEGSFLRENAKKVECPDA